MGRPPGTDGRSRALGGRTRMAIGAIAAAAVAVAAIFAYSYLSARQATDGGSGSRSTSPTPATAATAGVSPAATARAAPVTASVLVFRPSTAPSSSTTSIVALDGTVKHSLSSNASDATYDAAYEQPILLLESSTLITTDKSWSAFDVLEPDGSATPTASSLAALLGGIAHPSPASELSNGMTLGKSTLLAVESSTGSSDMEFVKIDLVGGGTTTLLTVHPTSPGLPTIRLWPATTSLDGSKVYLLGSDATVNSTPLSGVSLVTLDLVTGDFALKTLQAQIDPALAAVSSDGNLIGYEVNGGVRNGFATWQTHIYDVQSASDTTIPGESILPPGGSNGIRFSPNGAYLFEAGNYAADTQKAGRALRVISVSSNTTVRQIDLPGVQNDLECFGWAGDHAVIYTTDTSSTGNFSAATEMTHSLDPATGSVFDFPKSLGALVTVLNYQV